MVAQRTHRALENADDFPQAGGSHGGGGSFGGGHGGGGPGGGPGGIAGIVVAGIDAVLVGGPVAAGGPQPAG